MSKDRKAPIVVRRKTHKAEHAHGGAWKIAYADFVTAMMAFFLLLWMLGSTAKGDLKGIADYFQTPLKVALAGGSGSGDSSSVIQGGGTDLTRSHGQRKQGDLPVEKRTINLKAAEAELERIEAARLNALKFRLDSALEGNPTLRNYRKQIRVDLTNEGLRIQILDELNRPMFDSGRAVLKEYMRDIIREIAQVVNNVPNRVSLAGHTDSASYALGLRGYSNWELSADRANAARRELIAGGIEENKIIRVLGLSSSVPLDKADSTNPINRRISITILNQKAERRILEDGVPADGPAHGDGAPASGTAAGSESATHPAVQGGQTGVAPVSAAQVPGSRPAAAVPAQ